MPVRLARTRNTLKASLTKLTEGLFSFPTRSGYRHPLLRSYLRPLLDAILQDFFFGLWLRAV